MVDEGVLCFGGAKQAGSHAVYLLSVHVSDTCPHYPLNMDGFPDFSYGQPIAHRFYSWVSIRVPQIHSKASKE